MKVRSGYVSNSSSSSFVIFGTRIKNPQDVIKSGKRVFVFIDGGGTSGEAEDWGMFLDQECFDLLQKSKWFARNKNYTTFFECPDSFYDDENDKLVVSKPIKGVEIFGFERDYSSPNNVEQLKKFLEEVY